MYIKLVELEDIKSHADAKFEFSRGSTAITGDNGAGKTTIIEAIAWTLFDVLDYKKDDFVRRGAKKGTARVTFESGLDEREYTVIRDTGTAYFVYDPQLGMRVADKKEEVTRFLWQHLGVEPGTDLESLYKHAIGVPQGTFTAIFLATAAERKKTFDTLLKVEEYRRGAEELLRTQRFVEAQIGQAREKIARSEGELSRIDVLETDLKESKRQASVFAEQAADLERTAEDARRRVAELDKLAAAHLTAAREFDTAKAELDRLQLVRSQRESELQESRTAAEKIEAVRVDAERHTTVLGRISELERERAERDRLNSELRNIEKAEEAVRSDEKIARSKLAEIESAHREIAELGPKAAEQNRIEGELDAALRSLAAARASAEQLASLDLQLAGLRERFIQNRQQLQDVETRRAEASRVNELSSIESSITTALANLRAELDRDERFQKEINNGICPILSERCLNLKPGQTLEGFVKSQFEDLKSQISVLESQSKENAALLASSREAAKIISQGPIFEQRRDEIELEGKRLRQEHDKASAAARDAAELAERVTELEWQLRSLDNPRQRAALLERQITSESDIRHRLSETEKNLERLESDRRILVEQTESYRDLDMHWGAALKERDDTAEAQRTFLVFEAAAKLLQSREREAENAASEHSRSVDRTQTARDALELAAAEYNEELHNNAKTALQAAQRGIAETAVRLENATKRAEELQTELERLSAVRVALIEEQRECERLEGVLETTVFIRDTLKEAAPLVARNYVHHVSAEANMMFREVFGNAECSLRWGEDYGISMEEGGHERPFQSLSGGEQMVAALSVRLALLKQLSDIRIAFFDEPTTNMDAGRRENLAMQIGEIRHFDQLFVISHDDTFDGYMDSELRIDSETPQSANLIHA
jgi:exonuclease SbcC